MDALQKILVEEGENNDVNYNFMQAVLKYKNAYLTNKSRDMFLAIDSLIGLNNIITGSQHIGLRHVNVKPAGHKKHMDKSFIEAALYSLIDQFNDRLMSHKDFCRIFLD